MIIVSQDRKAIINFDNINEIRVTNTNNIVVFDNTYRSSDDCSDILATYKTEERVREILQEIINKYLEYASIRDGLGNKKLISEIPKVYYMPKE